jgi:hypothetical protein
MRKHGDMIFGVAHLSSIHVECVSTDDTVSTFPGLPATTSQTTGYLTQSLTDHPSSERPKNSRCFELVGHQLGERTITIGTLHCPDKMDSVCIISDTQGHDCKQLTRARSHWHLHPGERSA